MMDNETLEKYNKELLTSRTFLNPNDPQDMEAVQTIVSVGTGHFQDSRITVHSLINFQNGAGGHHINFHSPPDERIDVTRAKVETLIGELNNVLEALDQAEELKEEFEEELAKQEEEMEKHDGKLTPHGNNTMTMM